MEDEYVKHTHKYCMAYNWDYHTYDLAREACTEDPECTMFSDKKGEGVDFALCKYSTQVKDDADPTILYTNQGK